MPDTESAQAWRELLSAFADLDQNFLAGPQAVRGHAAVAEGYRNLATILGVALDMNLFADPVAPRFIDTLTPTRPDRRWGGDNTDCYYSYAVVDPRRTYRVSGRPHPDGALAFLFEDISDEISLSRRFRLEQETVQLLLDRLDQAIAVFSPGGTLMLCNARYAGIWGVPGGRLLDLTLGQEIARWRSASAPSPIWGQVAHLGAMDSDCREIAGTIRLGDGRALAARFACLAGGRICAEFSESARSDALSLVPGDAMAASGA